MAGLSLQPNLRFPDKNLEFIGCVATEKTGNLQIVTLDTGVGRVFRQIKDGIPPDSAFLFPTLVSIRETRWEWHGHGRALVSASGLCLPSPPTPPFVRAAPASADQSPPVDKPHSSCSLPLLLPQAGVPFSPTHPPRLSSYTPPPWGCLLRRLHSTDHPDTMTLTQPLAQLVSCAVFPSHTVDWEPGKPKGCVQLPQPLQCPTQEPPLEIQGFPSATILSPDF